MVPGVFFYPPQQCSLLGFLVELIVVELNVIQLNVAGPIYSLIVLETSHPNKCFVQLYIMTSVVSILQVIRDAAQRVYSFSNDQAG